MMVLAAARSEIAHFEGARAAAHNNLPTIYRNFFTSHHLIVGVRRGISTKRRTQILSSHILTGPGSLRRLDTIAIHRSIYLPLMGVKVRRDGVGLDGVRYLSPIITLSAHLHHEFILIW